MKTEMMNEDEIFKLLNPEEELPKRKEDSQFWELLEKDIDEIKIDKDEKYNLNFNFIN